MVLMWFGVVCRWFGVFWGVSTDRVVSFQKQDILSAVALVLV